MSRSTNSSDAFSSSFMSVDPEADSSRPSTNWIIGGKNRVHFVLSLEPLWKTVSHLCSASNAGTPLCWRQWSTLCPPVSGQWCALLGLCFVTKEPASHTSETDCVFSEKYYLRSVWAVVTCTLNQIITFCVVAPGQPCFFTEAGHMFIEVNVETVPCVFHCWMFTHLWPTFAVSPLPVAAQHVWRPAVHLHRSHDRILCLLRCHFPRHQGNILLTVSYICRDLIQPKTFVPSVPKTAKCDAPVWDINTVATLQWDIDLSITTARL